MNVAGLVFHYANLPYFVWLQAVISQHSGCATLLQLVVEVLQPL